MSTKNRLMLIAVLSLAAVVMRAEAKDARVHAFDCKTFGGIAVDKDFSLQNDSTSQYMHVVCPIPDTSSFPKAAIKTLNVHGYDNGADNNGVKARMCLSSWNATGGTCTSFTYWGGVKEYSYELLPVDLGHKGWTYENAADFGYIHIILPPKKWDGSRASVRGYFISDQPPY